MKEPQAIIADSLDDFPKTQSWRGPAMSQANKITEALNAAGYSIVKTKDITEAISIADKGLKWVEHKDFPRVYTALEKVFKLLKSGPGKA